MPETIGLLILSGTGIGGLGGIAGLGTIAGTTIAGVSIATVVGTAAIIGATIGLNYALAAKPDIPTPESGSQPIKQAIPPRIRGYGINRLAGFYMLFEAAGAPPNVSYDVIAFHSGRIDSISAIYFNDDPVRTSPDISGGGSGTIGADYADGRYGGSHIVVEIQLGAASQPGSVILVGDTNIGPVWNANFKGNGIAWAAMKCGGLSNPSDFTKCYPRGKPELSVVAECSPVWDPRDPLQLRDDESTWQVSRNPVVQLIDYLTRADGGMGEDINLVLPAPKLAEWIVEADICDQLVDTVDAGQEPRYRCDGWFQFNNSPETVINNILASCDGWLAESGDGALSLTVGLYREPTVDPITEKHVIGFALNYGTPDEQMVNQLDITFTDPASKYVSVQTQPWRDEESISLTGDVKSQQLDLTWVQSNSQARRLASRAMQRLNPAMTGSFTTTLYGLRYLGKRWVPLQYPFVSGLQDCVVEIQGAEIDLLGGRIVWSFISIAGSAIEAYSPDTDEGSAPVTPPPLAGSVRLDFSFTNDSQYLALLEDI